MTMKVTVVPNVTGKINRVPIKAKDIEFLNKEFSHGLLVDMVSCHSESTSIDMLIGSDYYFDLLEPHKLGLGGGLCLFNSKLGWIMGGRSEDTTVKRNPVPSLLVRTVGTAPGEIKQTTHMLSSIDPALACKSTLDQFWNLESIGITDSLKTTDDDKALDTFERTVECVDNRYFVSWPWKRSDVMLPENYHLALG